MTVPSQDRAFQIHTKAWNERAASLRKITATGLSLSERQKLDSELTKYAVPAPVPASDRSGSARQHFAARHAALWRAAFENDDALQAEFAHDGDAFLCFMSATIAAPVSVEAKP